MKFPPISTLLVPLLFLAATARAADQPSTRPVPPELQVDGTVILRVRARGFQVYTCGTDASGKLIWMPAVPEAEFVAADGAKGKHYKGPTWEIDGAKVVGQKILQHDSDSPNAIPWLLLRVISHEGSGKFADATYVQRLNTVGGKAPPITNQKSGDEARVPYSAEYVFYGPGATTQP